MAEGHAVARWADALASLIGEKVIEVRAPRRWEARAAELVGAIVTDVRSHGKHLVLFFSVPLVVHAHAMQYGSWQIGERGLTPRKAERYVRLRLVTGGHEALFFHGPVMEILSPAEFAAHDRFHSLGPDLLHGGFDIPLAVRRVRAAGTREVGDVIVDQRAVAGIGNIYKSEGLFLAKIHPRTAAAQVPPAKLRTLFATLIPLMQAGRLRYGATTTIPDEMQADGGTRNWVYRRRGRPCFVCGTPIEMTRQGPLQRMVFFCPSCQRPVIASARFSARSEVYRRP